jgi:hypothetical protein
MERPNSHDQMNLRPDIKKDYDDGWQCLSEGQAMDNPHKQANQERRKNEKQTQFHKSMESMERPNLNKPATRKERRETKK